nr:hypothetical protein [Tanacetum cinerariifolium]
MIAILEKSEHNVNFHQTVDFVEASISGTKILATVDGKPMTIFESSIRSNLKLNDEEGISNLPDAELFENLALMGYNIFPNQKFTFQKDEHASLLRDDSQGEAFPIVSSLDAGQDKENIIKTSALPHESTPRVTSLDADEGSMQQNLQELMDIYTSLQRQHDEMASKLTAQDLEISSLKARIKLLEDKAKASVKLSGDDAPIKGRRMEIGEEAGVERSTKRGSNDTEEMVNVLTSMDAANIFTSGVQDVSVPPATEVSIVGVPAVSGLVPTVSSIFTTASMVTPYSRRPREISAKDKGKEKMVESNTPRKRKLQEQIDVQVDREMEEEIAREDQRKNEQ